MRNHTPKWRLSSTKNPLYVCLPCYQTKNVIFECVEPNCELWLCEYHKENDIWHLKIKIKGVKI